VYIVVKQLRGQSVIRRPHQLADNVDTIADDDDEDDDAPMIGKYQ